MKAFIYFIVGVFASYYANAQAYTVSGNLTGFSDGIKVSIADPDNQILLDTPKLKDGKFIFKGINYSEKQPIYLFISIQDKSKLYKRFFYAGSKHTVITGDAKTTMDFWDFKGSEHQDVMNKYNILTRDIYFKRENEFETLLKIYADTTTEAKILKTEIINNQKHYDSLLEIRTVKFISENYNSFFGLKLLWSKRKLFTNEEISQFISNLDNSYKISTDIENIYTYLKVGDILKTGDRAVDFEASDSTGTKHRLFDYKGKYVLLDFSESFCAPCIASIPELITAYEKYRNSLQIITFDVDATREKWLDAIRRDKTPWVNIWDGKGTASETILKYGATGFPTFVLIDPQGKIIAKSSGYFKGTILGLLKKMVK